MSLASLGGGIASDAPTWQFVQNAIASNMRDADKAIQTAYSQINLIAERYKEIQINAPLSWGVDVDLSDSVQSSWPVLPIVTTNVEIIQAPEFEAELTAVDSADTAIQGVMDSFGQIVPDGVTQPKLDNIPKFTIDGSKAPEPGTLPGTSEVLGDVTIVDWPSALLAIQKDIVNTSLYNIDSDDLTAVFNELDNDISASKRFDVVGYADTGLPTATLPGATINWDEELAAINVALVSEEEYTNALSYLSNQFDYSNIARFEMFSGQAPASLPVDDVLVWPNDLPAISDNVIDLALYDLDLPDLAEALSFTEPTYVPQIGADLKTEILRVLGGAVGIPQEYWDALWSNVSSDIARVQVGVLRNARNRGAASHWGLPTEAVLTASRAAQDETDRKLQQVRYEQAKLQAELAEKGFWSAVERGLAYEQQWLTLHDQIAGRAFAAAEKTTSLLIQQHNSNVALYNARLEKAKFDQSEVQNRIANKLKTYAEQLSYTQAQIENNKQKVARYLAAWQAFQTENNVNQALDAEKLRSWAKQQDLLIGQHNANVALFNTVLERAKFMSSEIQARVANRLKAYATELQELGVVIESDKQQVARYLADWQAYQIENQVQRNADAENTKWISERVQWWGKKGDLLIGKQNSNIALNNAKTEVAKTQINEQQSQTANVLKAYATDLQELSLAVDVDKQKVARYLAAWQAYQIENQVNLAGDAEQARWWSTQAESHIKYLGVQMDATKIDLSYYAALLSRLETVAKATTMMTQLELDAQKTEVAKQTLALDEQQKRNTFELEKVRVKQAAEEVKAKLDIMQSQWLGGQGNELLKDMAQLMVGLAQALTTVSDVNLSSGYQASDSYSVSHSRNAELVS